MKSRSRILNSTARYNIALFLVLVTFVVFFTFMNPKFLAKFNIFLLFRQNLPTMITACALMFVVTSGSIDLSVGGVMAFCAITYAALCVKGVNPWWAIGIVVLIGVGIGLINTLLIEKLGIPAFMATIAGWLIYAGSRLPCAADQIQSPNRKCRLSRFWTTRRLTLGRFHWR